MWQVWVPRPGWRSEGGEGEEAGRPSSRLKGRSSRKVSSGFCPAKVGEVKDERGRHCGRVITMQRACLSGPSSASCSVQVLFFFQFESNQSRLVIIIFFLCCFPVFLPVSRDRGPNAAAAVVCNVSFLSLNPGSSSSSFCSSRC